MHLLEISSNHLWAEQNIRDTALLFLWKDNIQKEDKTPENVDTALVERKQVRWNLFLYFLAQVGFYGHHLTTLITRVGINLSVALIILSHLLNFLCEIEIVWKVGRYRASLKYRKHSLSNSFWKKNRNSFFHMMEDKGGVCSGLFLLCTL